MQAVMHIGGKEDNKVVVANTGPPIAAVLAAFVAGWAVAEPT